MRLIQNTRTKTTLKEITAYAVRKVFHPSVPPMRFPNGPSQGRVVFGNRNKMGVIGHQAPRQNLDTKPTQLLGHDIGIRATILVIAEDGD
jgi:hypothetical protein